MILKAHLCGLATAYHERGVKTTNNPGTLPPSRVQGSLISYQKKQIANAVEWLRLYGENRPLVFCLTSPGELSDADQPRFLKSLLDNFRANYGLTEYVWVREYTLKGFPHFHFVADMPNFVKQAKDLSVYWSSFFGKTANNSIRLGTYQGTKRTGFYIRNQSMAWYMSKYFAKTFAIEKTDGTTKRRPRRFAISKQLGKSSQPLEYEEILIEKKNVLGGVLSHSRQFVCIGPENHPELGTILQDKDLKQWRWSQCGIHPVYSGIPKTWRHGNAKNSSARHKPNDPGTLYNVQG